MKLMPMKWMCVVMGLFGLLVLQGCAGTSGPPPGESSLSGFMADMSDIELPSEMKWDREKSLSIKTESFRGGVMLYSGRVDALSLRDFVTSAMRKNKWKLVGDATYKQMLLAFVKPSKTCMMIITDSLTPMGNTHVTAYVTVDETAAASLNPFGEPVRK